MTDPTAVTVVANGCRCISLTLNHAPPTGLAVTAHIALLQKNAAGLDREVGRLQVTQLLEDTLTQAEALMVAVERSVMTVLAEGNPETPMS